MTYRQFLAELRQISGWRLNKRGEIRRGHKPRLCLITAVYWKIKGVKRDELLAEVVAKELGLADAVMSRIIDAADSADWQSSKTRRDLLKACSLKEVKRGKAQ